MPAPRKAFFLGIPSVSVHKSLTPLLRELAEKGEHIYYFNRNDFYDDLDGYINFIAYPDNFRGYDTSLLDSSTTYFDLAEMLLESSDTVMDFLQRQVFSLQPHYIMYSHLALWGKLLALKNGLTPIGLHTTFILDPQIMLPFFRRQKKEQGGGTDINKMLRLQRNYHKLYRQLGLSGTPDIWDAYVNRGELNIAFIHPALQPQPELLLPVFRFVGYALQPVAKDNFPRLVYVSMGTIFNEDVSFFRTCIDVLKKMELPAYISIGNKIDREDLGEVPSNIIIAPYFPHQLELLSQAIFFITRGGMASVHEALGTATPMLVIPVIPEQQITAASLVKLQAGLSIQPSSVNADTLANAMQHLLSNRYRYSNNIKLLAAQLRDDFSPTYAASEYILGHLHSMHL